MKKSFKDYENILAELKEYSKKDRSKSNFDKDVNSIEKVLNSQKFTIAVVANMSAGKSTFINALFGDDILPALNKATTDCATYIQSDNNPSNNQAVIYFEDKRKKSVLLSNDKVKEEIKYYAMKDNDDITDRYKGVDKIELDWDFLNIKTDSQNKIEVTFIDTPGPNNTEEEFSEKHKNQTAKLINEVDMILYLFDYEQLDAILTGDKQGIWSKIQSRHENDEEFDVYFVINKIDISLKNLFKNTKDKDKLKQKIERQENWYKEIDDANNKIVQAAKKHSFKEPKVYTISAELALWNRQYNDDLLDEDYEGDFHNRKNDIEKVWKDSWEEKFHELLGFEKLESDINNFIKNTLEEKVLKKVHEGITNILNHKKYLLETKLQIGNQNKNDAKKNLHKAKKVLEEKMPEISKVFSLFIEEKEENITSDINDKLLSNKSKYFADDDIEKIAKKSINFLMQIAQDASYKKAKDSSSIRINYNNISLLKSDGIEQNSKNNKEELFSFMNNYCIELINDTFREFKSDSRNDTKKLYTHFKNQLNTQYIQSKNKLQNELNQNLEIKLQNVNSKLYTIDIESENLKIELDKTLIETENTYGIMQIGKIAKWFKKSWFQGKKIKFDVPNFYSNLKSNIEIELTDLIHKEKESHKNKVRKFSEQYRDIFTDFEDLKSTEIDELIENFSLIQQKEESLKENIAILENIIGKLSEK